MNNRIEFIKFIADRIANPFDGKIPIVGGRLIEFQIVFDPPLNKSMVISVLLNDVWVADVDTPEKFQILYELITGQPLLTNEEYHKQRDSKPIAVLNQIMEDAEKGADGVISPPKFPEDRKDWTQ
jgi:hypothetical protein